MKAPIIFLIAIFFISPGIAAAPSNPASRDCFDVAIVATAPRYKWYPIKHDRPDEIILDSPVRITFDVEEVLTGYEPTGTVDVFTTLHTDFNPKIRHFLLFLRRRESEGFSLAHMSLTIVEDRNGDFAWPVARPLNPSYWNDDDFIPRNYESLLKPIRYRPADAWWLSPTYVRDEPSEPVSVSDYPWGRLDHGRIVALRGLRVRDLVRTVSSHRCP